VGAYPTTVMVAGLIVFMFPDPHVERGLIVGEAATGVLCGILETGSVCCHSLAH